MALKFFQYNFKFIFDFIISVLPDKDNNATVHVEESSNYLFLVIIHVVT